MNAPWRTGRSLGRTLYVRKHTTGPSKDDHFVGLMDTPELAGQVVDAVNAIARICEVERELRSSIDPTDHYAARRIREAIGDTDG